MPTDPIDHKLSAFENRLRKVWKHYSKLARRQDVSCFRIYDHDLPEAPLAIDWYDGVVHAAEYKRRHGMDDDQHASWLEAIRMVIAQVLETEADVIFMKVRQRKAGRQGQYEKFDSRRSEKIVGEGGLRFIINLTDYLDTGLFLDHRITRSMVRDVAKDNRVLNLFCYTGSFSTYAAHGGASEVCSVDMSKTYINWAKRNMQYNKLYKPEAHDFIQADVLDWISEVPKNRYDLIICDPPTFSNSKRMDTEWDVQRDHVPLIKNLLRILSDSGQLFFSTNYRDFVLDRDALPASVVRDITAATTPFDFAGKLQRSCFILQR